MFSSPNICKSADLVLLLAMSGTRVAEHNTRTSAKTNLCTERGRTCNICASPRLLLWKLNPLTHGCVCWGIQQLEHPGEPVRVVVFAPAAGCCSLPFSRASNASCKKPAKSPRIISTRDFKIFLHIVINEPLTKHL